MARRKLSRLVRKHEVYTAAEAAVLLGRTAWPVRRWIADDDLPAARDQKPWLIDGHDLKRFLDDRDRARQVTLSETEFYCLSCRAARSPTLGLVGGLSARHAVEGPVAMLLPSLRARDVPCDQSGRLAQISGEF